MVQFPKIHYLLETDFILLLRLLLLLHLDFPLLFEQVLDGVCRLLFSFQRIEDLVSPVDLSIYIFFLYLAFFLNLPC
jgi:hypothetical protein